MGIRRTIKCSVALLVSGALMVRQTSPFWRYSTTLRMLPSKNHGPTSGHDPAAAGQRSATAICGYHERARGNRGHSRSHFPSRWGMDVMGQHLGPENVRY
jgi:hypothetical protein